MSTLLELVGHTWAMIAEMGGYLLLGLAIAALLHKVVRDRWIQQKMGKKGIGSIVWGCVVGVPMPLCSCGVIPVALSLRDKGASRGATVSFLTSTPQTGADSFLATYGMLGPIFAIYKVFLAFISGILVGLAIEGFAPDRNPKQVTATPAGPQASQPTWRQSFAYGFFSMPRDLAPRLMLGFILAGAISALAPADFLANVPGGLFATIALVTLISVPFYICSTGSIPLALALVHNGLPISAALVLLFAGPTTSIVTIATMRKALGGRETLIYVSGVVLSAWCGALVFEMVFGQESFAHHAMNHHMGLTPWHHAGGALLLALLAYPFIAERLKPAAHQPVSDSSMRTATIHIQGMSCSHCERSISEGLASLSFAQSVLNVSRSSGIAIVQGKTIDEVALKQKIEALGFVCHGVEVR